MPMNPVLRLVSGDANSPADAPIREFIPGFEPRPAAPRVEPTVALQTGHLGRCPRCGELNGRSAEACWNCEADLQTIGPRSVQPAPEPVATASNHEPWHDLGQDAAGQPSSIAEATTLPTSTFRASENLGQPLPVLTLSVEPSDWMSAYAAQAPQPPVVVAPQRQWALVAAAAAILVVSVGVGAYLYVDHDVPSRPSVADLASMRERGLANQAVQPGARMTPPATSVGGDLSKVDEALRTAEMLTRPPLEAAAPAPVVPAAAPPVADAGQARAALQQAPRPRPRATPRSDVTTALAPESTRATLTRSVRPAPTLVPVQEPTRSVRPPAAPVGPCTPTVAALGLCAAPSSQPKE